MDKVAIESRRPLSASIRWTVGGMEEYFGKGLSSLKKGLVERCTAPV